MTWLFAVRHFFIARQHAYARRARYCYGKSVCLSVCLSHSGIVSKRMHISSNSFDCFVYGGTTVVFFLKAVPPLQNSKENTLTGGVKYKIAIFARNRRLSRKRSVSVPMTLSDLERRDARGQNFWRISIITPKRFDRERWRLVRWTSSLYARMHGLTIWSNLFR